MGHCQPTSILGVFPVGGWLFFWGIAAQVSCGIDSNRLRRSGFSDVSPACLTHGLLPAQEAAALPDWPSGRPLEDLFLPPSVWHDYRHRQSRGDRCPSSTILPGGRYVAHIQANQHGPMPKGDYTNELLAKFLLISNLFML